MAQTIKLKRSSTGGAVPSTSSLSLGEVAINTYDGKMYIKKNDGSDAIVEIGAGNGEAVWNSYDYTATSSQTSFSGSDNNSETLSYVPNFLQVFLNGILLDPAVDYAATTGNSIVLTVGASTSDLIQIETFTQIIGTGDILVDTFPVSSTQTAFTLSQDPINKSNISVYVEGVYQESSTYSLSGTTLTLSESPANGTTVEVVIGTRNVTLDGIVDLTISGTLHAGALDLGDANIINVNEISLDTIKGDADANTNITFAGSDVTTFTQGGQERLRLNTTGAQVTGNIVVSGTVDGRDVAADGVTADAALSRAGGAMGGAITTNSTFDGRDVSVDGTKLDGIESGATADQTDVEIRAAVESASDSNVFTNADHSKLDAIEALADVTDATNVTAAGALMRAGGTMTGNLTVPNLSITSTNWLGFGDYGERISGSNSSSSLSFYTDATVALTLDSSQNATFAGTIDSGAITSTGDVEVRSGNKLILQRPNNGVASNISTDSTGAMILDSLNTEGFFFNNNGTNAFKLDPVNATFAGDITTAHGVQAGYFKIGSTVIVNSTRDLTNIGTISSGAITTSGNVSVGGSAYTTATDLNLLGDGISIKNDKAGSNNNWSLIQNTDTGSASNLSFTTGLGVALTLNHNKSATFGGPITGTTATASGGTNTTALASTAFVQQEITTLIGGAPANLDTLNELAAAINDEASYAAGITNLLTLKAPLASPAFNSGATNVVASFTSTDGYGGIQLADPSGNVELTAVGNDFHIQNAGAAAKMVVLNTGKVGIGTAGPLAVLEIDPPAVDTPIFAIRRQDNATIPLFKFFQDSSVAQGTGHAHMNTGNRDLSITTDTNSTKTNGIYIKTTGQVGIGTASPNNKLTVTGGSDGINIQGTSSYLRWNSGDMMIRNEGSYAMGFHTYDGSSAQVERMRIASNGNVGIGTDTPSSKLHVKHGDIRLEGNAESGQDITFTITNDNSGNEVEAGLIRFIDTGGGQSNRGAAIASYMPTADTGDLRFYTSAGADRVERMRINGDGKLLLNATTTAFGDKLYVNGDAYVTGGWRTGTAATFVGELTNASGILTLQSDANRDIQLGDTNNPDIVYVDTSTQKVGIGTTAPSNLLSLKGLGNNWNTSPAMKLWDAQYSKGWYVGTANNQAAGDYYIRSVTSESAYPVSADQQFTITQGGNVGIGTIAPDLTLDVSHATASEYVATFQNTGSNLQLKIGTEPNDGGYLNIQGARVDNGNPYNLSLQSEGGSVGIGTSLPAQALQVNGNIRINHPDGGGAPGMTAQLQMYGYEGRGVGIKIRDSVNSAASANNREWFIGSGYAQNGFNIGYASDGSQSSYAAQNKLTITTDGKVGLGTSNPAHNFVVAASTNGIGIELVPGSLSYIQAYNRGTSDYGDLKIDAQSIRFGTDNGTERARISSTGRLHINHVNDPGWDSLGTLVVKQIGNDYGIGVVDVNSQNTFKMLNNTTFAEFSYNVNLPIIFTTGTGSGTERMRIHTGGNVGIGANNPNTKLEVAGIIKAGDLNATAGGVFVTGKYGDNLMPNIFGAMYSSAFTLIGYGVRSHASNSNTFLSTADNAAWSRGALQVGSNLIFSNAGAQTTAVGSNVTMTERFRVAANGNVGMGATVITSADASNAFIVKTNHSGNPTALQIGGSGAINGVSSANQSFTILNVAKDSGSGNSAYFHGNVKTAGVYILHTPRVWGTKPQLTS